MNHQQIPARHKDGYLPTFDEIVLESPEFNFESLKELPDYYEKRYTDALYMG